MSILYLINLKAFFLNLCTYTSWSICFIQFFLIIEWSFQVRGDQLRDSLEVTALKPCVLRIVEGQFWTSFLF